MDLLTELQYFPPVTFYRGSYEYSNIVFEQYEHYQKMSFRNRAMIAGANGMIILSVPLELGRNQKTLMKDVKIAKKERWQKQHWRSIFSCYNHSPWFEHYRDELARLYERDFDFLLDWNLCCFEWVVRQLEWATAISLTHSFEKNYDSMQWLDLRNKILPKNYKSFEAIKYSQVFEERIGFLPNLSILDLLFCEGKRAGELLAR